MFNRELYNLTLTNEIANDVFPNIVGDSYCGDNTFIATLRALLAPRMEHGDSIYLSVKTRADRESLVNDYSDKEYIATISQYVKNDCIFICGLNGSSGSTTASFKKIENTFTKINKGFEELKDLHVFIEKQAYVRFYINKEKRSTAIFVGSLSIRTWHLIQSFISRIVPWYFEDKPLDDDERILVKSLTNRYVTEYEKLIEVFAAKYDFRSVKVKKMLGGFEAKAKQKQIDGIRNQINNYQQYIQNNINEYNQLLSELDELIVKESGLTYQINEVGDDSEIVNYLLCNQHVNPIYVNDNHIQIIVDTVIENYDPEMFDRMLKNSKSALFKGYDVSADAFLKEEDRSRFLNAIFGDEPLLKIKVCAYYDLDIRGEVSSLRDYNYPHEYTDFLVNPHMHYHACIGNNRPIINKLLRDGDYITAIEQCQSSAKNLNLSEGSQTVAPFLGQLFDMNCKKVIQLPDGTSCTPTEAYEWLKNQEESIQEVTNNV